MDALFASQNKAFGAECARRGVSWSAFRYVPNPEFRTPDIIQVSDSAVEISSEDIKFHCTANPNSPTRIQFRRISDAAYRNGIRCRTTS
jgi:hypothetical protein